MTIFQPHLPPGLLEAAKNFSDSRSVCKGFLLRHGLGFDKFTAVDHDSLIGFISEHFMRQYLVDHFRDSGLTARAWDEDFDLRRIGEVIHSHHPSQEDIAYVRDYFYDKWDLVIRLGGETFYADVKTALTSKTPSPDWTFLYPVVQAGRRGKDLSILAYYVCEDTKLPQSFKSLIIAGFITEAVIRSCPVIKAGAHTRHGTKSQIDNFETELGLHYRGIADLFSGAAGIGSPCV